MSRRAQRRFTIYDAYEDSGVFDENPANVSSGQKYEKAEYPKMFYHPLGKERIIVPAEIIETPLGPKPIGEQREIIWAIAKNSAEEEKLRAEGWHDHPAKAIHAGGGAAPPISSQQRIDDMEAEIKKLRAQINEQKATDKVGLRAAGTEVDPPKGGAATAGAFGTAVGGNAA